MTVESEAHGAPSTPKAMPKPDDMNPRSPLLFIPSPARAKVSPKVSPPSKDGAEDEAISSWKFSKLAKLPQLSRLNADAKEFIPGVQHVVAAKRLRETKAWSLDLEPPVISVKKMASKGCAIVLLHDEHVIQLAARMAVAVIDGVCVELRRHSRRSKRDDRDEAGVFVAWGHRVERRATVSEEALEAFFNGLAKVNEPQALSFKPPFEESLLLFPLSSSKSADLMAPAVAEATPSALLDGPHNRKELVEKLWDAKSSLDALWNKPPPPLARSVMQRVARDQLFPRSKEGKDGHENRAGEKLEELAKAVGLLDGLDVPGVRFLDLCGGPGAWSQYLLQLGCQGFGFTLRSGVGGEEDWQAEQKDDWYPDLLLHPQWRALWGADGSGDLLKPGNLQHASQMLRSAGGVSICVADGGFSDKQIPPNLLELYFYRLFLAEILTAANSLVPGGRFVCKLYSTFSASTSALLFLLTRLFEDVRIVKPMSSRVAGPERYLFARGFRANEEVEAIKSALWSCHVYGAGRSPLQLPCLTPLVDVHQDARFLIQLQEMVVTLCTRQAGALRAIRERAETLEDMALEVAEEAQRGAELWGKRDRDADDRDNAARAHRPVVAAFSPSRAMRPQVTLPGKRRPGALGLSKVSAEFNRWR